MSNFVATRCQIVSLKCTEFNNIFGASILSCRRTQCSFIWSRCIRVLAAGGGVCAECEDLNLVSGGCQTKLKPHDCYIEHNRQVCCRTCETFRRRNDPGMIIYHIIIIIIIIIVECLVPLLLLHTRFITMSTSNAVVTCEIYKNYFKIISVFVDVHYRPNFA